MRKYLVTAEVKISVSTDVEASSPEEAIEIAKERDLCSLPDPSHMGDSPEDVWVHSGELDGTPCGLAAEEAE